LTDRRFGGKCQPFIHVFFFSPTFAKSILNPLSKGLRVVFTNPFFGQVSSDFTDIDAHDGCAAKQGLSCHQRPSLSPRSDQGHIGGQHSIINDVSRLMAQYRDANHPTTLLKRLARLEGQQMPLLRSPRVGWEQDVNRLFFPGLFHGPNGTSPLTMYLGYARNGFHSLGR